jgi:phosphinothricin acetyltransferase
MATPKDAGAIAGIYLPYVRDTVVSFEAVAPGVPEMRSRMTSTLATLPWLVVTDGEDVKGYAHANPHRARDAYRWSVDVSLYLDASIHARGHGRRIYTALLKLLAAQGYVNAYAGITLPNPASVGLHEALGFTTVGVFPDVGFKQQRWWDVGSWHRRLADPSGSPPEPRPWTELADQTIDSALEAKTL